MTNTGTADLMKCASKIYFRTRRVRYTSRRQVLDYAKKVTFLTVYHVPRNISICLPRRLKRIFLTTTCRTRVDKKRIEIKTTTPDRKSICLYSNVTYTNTPSKITRKYAFMVIPRINIKRLTRMFCYSSQEIATTNKN